MTLPKAFVWLVLPPVLLAALGCGRADHDDEAAGRAAARVRAAFAVAEAERAAPPGPVRPDPPDGPADRRPDPNCPRCHGSGTVPSGDGLARVPCACLNRSSKGQEIKNRAAGDSPRVLVFTASWCAACRGLKPAVAGAGAGFELIDVDAEPAAAAAFGITAVPTLVRVVGAGADARETARASGPRGVSGLRRFRDAGR